MLHLTPLVFVEMYAAGRGVHCILHSSVFSNEDHCLLSFYTLSALPLHFVDISTFRELLREGVTAGMLYCSSDISVCICSESYQEGCYTSVIDLRSSGCVFGELLQDISSPDQVEIIVSLCAIRLLTLTSAGGVVKRGLHQCH